MCTCAASVCFGHGPLDEVQPASPGSQRQLLQSGCTMSPGFLSLWGVRAVPGLAALHLVLPCLQIEIFDGEAASRPSLPVTAQGCSGLQQLAVVCSIRLLAVAQEGTRS